MAFSENTIHNFYGHKVTGNIDDSFIGIKVKNDRIDFYYPESYALSDINDVKYFRKDVISIINTIGIAKTLSSDKAKIETSLADKSTFALHSYLWIIKDFLANGIYINREKVLKRNQRGKINWKRTLQNQPIISNGNVIYTDLVVEVPNQSDNIIVEIHKYCIRKSIEYIGWLFGLSANIIECEPFNKGKKKLYISVLKKELNSTFDDLKKLRLSHMLKVICGIDDDTDGNEFVYGVDNYYYIFERMIDSIFGNVPDISKFNPKSNWYLKRDNFEKTPSSELRPDTVLIDNDTKTAYILDSKYYRFGTTGLNSDLPESTSIQKQITYGEYIKQNYLGDNIANIRSAFLLPYDKCHNKFDFTENLEYIGYSKAEWKDNTEEHQIIYAFLIDLKHTITTWNVRNHHDEDIQKLIKSIENEVSALNL